MIGCRTLKASTYVSWKGTCKYLYGFCDNILWEMLCTIMNPQKGDKNEKVPSIIQYWRRSLWSKTTLIIIDVGEAGADPPTCKMWTFSLISLALSVPIFSNRVTQLKLFCWNKPKLGQNGEFFEIFKPLSIWVQMQFLTNPLNQTNHMLIEYLLRKYVRSVRSEIYPFLPQYPYLTFLKGRTFIKTKNIIGIKTHCFWPLHGLPFKLPVS